MPDSIDLRNIGPNAAISIPIPEGGGLVVLRGPNGAGKSQILQAIDYGTRGRGDKPSVRDGERKAEVDFAGVKMTVGVRTSKPGADELAFAVAAGQSDFWELVDPGIKDPEAADSRRLKALVSWSGAKADASLFCDLVGGEQALRDLLSADDLANNDPLTIAGRLKRSLETLARKAEDEAAKAKTQAEACKAAVSGIDLTAEANAITLQANYSAALSQKTRLEEQARIARKARTARAVAEDKLREAEAKIDGPTVEKALADREAANAKLGGITSIVEDLEEQLKQARHEQELARNAYAASIAAWKAAEANQTALAGWREQLAAELPPPVDDDAIDAAAEAVDRAQKASDAGAVIRAAKAKAAEGQKHLDAVLAHTLKAKSFREKAGGVDEVLSGIVAETCPELKIEAGRLRITRNGKTEDFSRLSAGERAAVALGIRIRFLPQDQQRRALIVIPQEAYEGLQPKNRAKLDAALREHGAVGITAIADDGELRVEVPGDGKQAVMFGRDDIGDNWPDDGAVGEVPSGE